MSVYSYLKSFQSEETQKKYYPLKVSILKVFYFLVAPFRFFLTLHNLYKIKKRIHSKEVIKLNLGCGTDYKEGWINIDNNSDYNISKLDLNWNLSRGLPFPANSVDFIFNEHFLEHLSVEQGKVFLKSCLKVLKPGGVIRIAMPDLAKTVASYYDEHWKENPSLKKFNLTFIKTRAEKINISFRWWGHQWLYDYEELERRIREVDSSAIITKCNNGKSDYSELCGLETRDESILIVEVTKG
ncbi:MAG: methyltransferase domain-containing protein [Thermoguttaceae bacterium]|nr:methyltransferase domain-containing protein [Thermoguttaceae bacterium]